MRLRLLAMAAAGCLSIGLVTGSAAVATAAPAAAFLAHAFSIGATEALAIDNADSILVSRYTGCTNFGVDFAMQSPGSAWLAGVHATCTGTA